MKILIFIVLYLCSGLCFCVSNEIKMVVDVVKAYEQPTAVLINVCWKYSDKITLMTQLMNTKKGVTVAFITDQRNIQKFDPKDTIIVTDLNCEDSGRFLKQADIDNLFSEPYRWFIISKKYEAKQIPIEIATLKILLNSEVVVANEIHNDTFELNLVYRIDAASEFRNEQFGVWTERGFKISKAVATSSMIIRRKDLNGKPIAASYVITDNSTRSKIHRFEDLKVDNIAKTTHHNILPLFYFMNATEVLFFTDTWGYYINNSWNGMMGHITHGEAELCGTVSFINLERVHIVQYITQPIPVRPKFLFREPPLSFQNNLYLLPFRGIVWLCFGALIVILIVIIYINAKWETSKHEGTMKESTVLKPNISDIGIFVISAITQQGSPSELKGSLGRVVTFLMFLIFLFLYTSYSANIVALLQSSSNQIRTLTDLLNSRLELGVEDEKYNRHYFPTATEPVRKAIYENKIAKVGYKPNFMSLKEGVKKLQNKDAPFAFHMNLGVGYKIVEELFYEHEKCGLREIEYFQNSMPWTCSRKVSPYREIYKIGLARTLEHGLGDRVNRIFYVRKPSCTTRGGSFASVNMLDFHPVLLWMLYGVILSVFLLVVEILMFRRLTQTEKVQTGSYNKK